MAADRKPWFLMHIRDTCDEMSETIVEALSENGRLRFVLFDGSKSVTSDAVRLDQIFAHVARKRGEDVSVVQEEATAAFVGLVHDRYIERCPSCTLHPPPLTLHTISSRRATNKGKCCR